MIKKINYKKGFSLAEVLISLLIVSVILAAMTPIFIKKASKRVHDGVVFTYSDNNTVEYDDEDAYCYQTSSDNDGRDSYAISNNCSEYRYIIPDGVHHINLTLMGGGGGGGGAEGAYQYSSKSEKQIDNYTGAGYSAIQVPNAERMKKIVIKLLTHKGQTGAEGGADGNYCAGGKGGASSSAIVNFNIPESMVKGPNYSYTLEDKFFSDDREFYAVFCKNLNDCNNYANSLGFRATFDKLGIQTGDSPFVLIGDSFAYGIKQSSDGNYSLMCSMATGQATPEKCLLGKDNYLESIEGTNGGKILKSAINNNVVMPGGLGAISPTGSMYGYGGNGETATFTSNTCTKSGSANLTNRNGNGFLALEYTEESPSAAGGGGAPGAAIRFVGIDVNPGDKLHIVVGKGGKGGEIGISSNSPTKGANGEGGTSSAVYLNGNLVAMVNGGAGGFGGGVINTYTGGCRKSNSGRNQAKVFYPTGSTLPKLASDLVATEMSYCLTDNANKPNSDLSAACLKYPALEIEPYATLNSRTGTYNSSGEWSTYGAYYSKLAYGGLSLSNCNFQASSIKILYSDVTIDDDTYTNIYDGLYHRSLIKNSDSKYNAGYIGGLGGFSGFGGKAGCGAYFQGNFDGRDDNDNPHNALKNKFILDEKAYDVNKYYDNCTTTTPNGASATFVAPNPKTLTFGQAGAGGGGGGYAFGAGSGNGGDGQNGYVMIDWLK